MGQRPGIRWWRRLS